MQGGASGNPIKTMQQYFLKTRLEMNSKFAFDKEQAHHIKNVLRMKNNDIVRAVDENQQVFYVEIEIENKEVYGKVVEQLVDESESSLEITLVMGMIKGDKWDYLIQKACECGVHKIVPLISKRCVIKAKEEKMDRKLERWNKIALEACEQCKRTHQVEVCEPVTMKKISEIEFDLGIIAYEDADFKASNLADLLKENPDVKKIAILIGPEGGFDADEVAFARSLNYHCVSLGNRILRAETAAIFSLNALVYHYDMLGEKL